MQQGIGKPSVSHAVVVIFLEFFAWGLLTTPMLTVSLRLSLSLFFLHKLSSISAHASSLRVTDKRLFLFRFFTKRSHSTRSWWTASFREWRWVWSVWIIFGDSLWTRSVGLQCDLCHQGLLSFMSAPLIGALSDVWGRRSFLLVTVFFTCAPIPLMRLSPWYVCLLRSLSLFLSILDFLSFLFLSPPYFLITSRLNASFRLRINSGLYKIRFHFIHNYGQIQSKHLLVFGFWPPVTSNFARILITIIIFGLNIMDLGIGELKPHKLHPQAMDCLISFVHVSGYKLQNTATEDCSLIGSLHFSVFLATIST